jgi:hypothetical protein
MTLKLKDSPVNRYYRKCGYRVETAISPLEAFTKSLSLLSQEIKPGSKFDAPSGQGRRQRAEGRRNFWEGDSDSRPKTSSQLNAVLENSNPNSDLLPPASCPLPSEQSEFD